MTENNIKNKMIGDMVLPTSPEVLLSMLDDIGVKYDLYNHEAVFTVKQSDKVNSYIKGAHCRNLFLRDKKKQMFLVVVQNETKIDLKKLSVLLDCGRLSFGSPERLWNNLCVKPGSVCPFSIINDKDHYVQIVLDADMMNRDVVNYHPMVNTMTIGLNPEGLLKFIQSCGCVPNVIDLSPAAPDE